MAFSFNGTNQFLSVASAPVTAAPLTISLWFYTTTTAKAIGMATICDSVGDTGFRVSGQIPNSTSYVQVAALNTINNFGLANSTANYSANAWQHSCAVFASSTSRTSYLNGGNAGTNTTSVTPASVTQFLIGVNRSFSTYSNYFVGRIADVGVWNAALTAAEVASLAARAACSKVRPASLIFYAPLIRDLVDIKGGRAITNNNAATVGDHPRIYL